MDIEGRKIAFAKLGIALKLFLEGKDNKYTQILNKSIKQAESDNPWFIESFVRTMLSSISEMLNIENLTNWISNYNLDKEHNSPKNIGVVMAGNIPLVGFHDMLCTLISGNNLLAKISSKDKILISTITEILFDIESRFKDNISMTQEKLIGIDAIIATGSNNTARYFDFYFGKYPNIIRKNRNSLAIISGNETPDELSKLADDIFLYFGLGCRNIAKILVPRDYDFSMLLSSFEKFEFITNHKKYSNNFKYYRTIYLMNKESFFDNGFILLKKDSSLNSPLGNLHFDYYDSEFHIEANISMENHNIQCIASQKDHSFSTVKFGETQHPNLWDYSDNIDTLAFLQNL